MKNDGYAAAAKIDKQITEFVQKVEDESNNIYDLLEAAKFVRTIKTTCIIFEEAILPNIQRQINEKTPDG